MKLVSVNILNSNGIYFLKSCLESVLKQSYKPIEINFIDNASIDNSVEFIQRNYPQLNMFINKINLGYAAGHNNGIGYAKGHHVLLLNPDVVLTPDYIANLVAVMELDKKIIAAQGKLLLMDSNVSAKDEQRLDTTGIFIGKNRRNYDRGHGEIDCGKHDEREFIFGASGAACLYKKDILEDIKIDGDIFDSAFFMYREEVDLSWRAQLLGWKCMYVPSAVAYHCRNYAPGRRKQMPRWMKQLQYRNRYLMIIKNELPVTFIAHLHHILIFEILSFFYVLFREPFLLRAWPDIFRLLPEMLRKRRLIMRKRRVHAKYMISLIK